MIFHKQVIAANQRHLVGEVLLVQPLSYYVVSGLVSLCCVVVLTLALTVKYSEVEFAIGFYENTWLEGIKLFGRPMFQFIGPANRIRQAAKENQRSWYRGITACHAVFGPP